MKKDPNFFMKKALLLAAKAEGAAKCRSARCWSGKGGSSAAATTNRSGRTIPAPMPKWWPCARRGRKPPPTVLNGCVLYVTLEPCVMCYSAMVHARIAKLVYGADDPKNGIFSSGVFDKMKQIYNHRIAVEKGLLAKPASAMLSGFFKARRGAGAVERDGLENRYGG